MRPLVVPGGRFRQRRSPWLLLALVVPPVVAGQTVLVRATDAETKRPVAGAIVRLVDTTARAVAQGLTSESGRLVLRAPKPGRYLLRADRIGHAGVWTEAFTVDDSISVALVMPVDRVFLPELAVSGSTSCEPRADGAETAALWTEVMKALTAEAITSANQTAELAVRRFRQHRTLAGGLQFDSTERLYRTAVSPFVSPPPATLERQGYIRSTRGGFLFHGPDALTLLSSHFLAKHCYSVVRPPNDSSLVGLGFVPTKEVKRPDVRGVLWVDRATNELRSLEFEYVNAPKSVRAPGIGGRVEFERLTTGAWIIRDWYIRAPRRYSSVLGFGRDTLVGYLDQGGTARPVGDPSLALGDAPAAVANRSTSFGDILGRLVDPDGRPIAGATVATTAVDSVHTTDREGRFELKDVPVGRLGVRVRAIGFRPLNLALTLSGERRVLDTTLTLPRVAQLLDSVVVTARAEPLAAGKMIDVERRRQAGFGKFLTRLELQDPLWGGLDTQLRRLARVRLVSLCGGLGFAAASPDRGSGGAVNIGCATACFMTVYLDGVPLWSPDMAGILAPPDLSQFHPQNLEAVEVYPTQAVVPIEFAGRLSPCGVILVWTSVGGPR